MKNYVYPMAFTAALFFATSCSDEVVEEAIRIPDSDKESIAFTTSADLGVASQSSMTRAGFTGGREYNDSYDYSTQIIARFSSKNGSTSVVSHTKTVLTAKFDASADKGANWESCSDVEYAAGHARYWDDAFGRDAQLSVYAVAVPNNSDVTNNSVSLFNLVKQGSTNVSTVNTTWQKDTETDALNSIAWQVSTSQTAGWSKTIALEDLCYSHNIQTNKDAATALQYGKGKDGVRTWGKYDESDRDAKGYPKYKYVSGDVTDHYPTLDDGTLQFRLTNSSGPTDGPGHFDKGHMIFHHALTRITVNLQKSIADGGYVSGSSDFVLTSDNITLLNMHYKGTLNFKDGTWSAYTEGSHADNANIKMAETTAATSMNYTSIAQVVPGYVLNENSTTNVMKFTVSDNTYYITQKQLYKALCDVASNLSGKDHNGNKLVDNTGNKITLEQGKNYVFTIKVKKAAIETITASLVPWAEVEGEAVAENDYVKISLMDATSTHCKYFDLYRMNDDQTEIYAPTTGPGTGTNWTENYNWYGNTGTAHSQNYYEKAVLESTSTDNVWKAKDWFWESNKSFYHFRSVNTGMTIQENETVKPDYFKMYGGPIQDYDASHTVISTAQNDNKVNDYHWGAPFKQGKTLTYDVTYGWSAEQEEDGQIYPAIGSTKDQIKLIEHHMMSNVHIILKTTEDAEKTNKLAEGSVNLKTSKVLLTNFANEGQVEMGTGKVTPSTDYSTPAKVTQQEVPAPTTFFKTSGDNTVTNPYSYRVIPQALYRTASPTTETDLTKFVGLTIITPDNNQYYVIKKLSDVVATSVTNQGEKTNQIEGNKITRWYPGYDYTYTITISKTGIQNITCSVVDWVNVVAENIDLNLED